VTGSIDFDDHTCIAFAGQAYGTGIADYAREPVQEKHLDYIRDLRTVARA
jgi:hypothetical protein